MGVSRPERDETWGRSAGDLDGLGSDLGLKYCSGFLGTDILFFLDGGSSSANFWPEK